MSSISQISQSLSQLMRTRPGTVALLSSPIALGLLHSVQSAYYHYIRWLNLGRGGLPYNAGGWIVNWIAYLFSSKDLTSLAPYSNPRYIASYGAMAKKSYLKRPLPRRDEPRPVVDVTMVAPQRQESGISPVNAAVREVSGR